MKKEVIIYFTKWLNYYGIKKEGVARVMGKVNELFKTYDEVVQHKVTKEWKNQRRSNNED